MSRNYRLLLKDILTAIKRIEKYTKGLTLIKFSENDLVLDAAVRNLEVIGEASKNLPDEVKAKYKDIEWKKIAGLRNIIAHEYFGIDVVIVWDIIKTKLPELKKALKQ
ncbi:MAG: DUF86 domain-containing protein [Candidatus Margulisiibacteriota bacterium]